MSCSTTNQRLSTLMQYSVMFRVHQPTLHRCYDTRYSRCRWVLSSTNDLQGVQTINDSSVSLMISPAAQDHKTFQITVAFTSKWPGLTDQSSPASLMTKYKHLKDLPLRSFGQLHPLLLIGADHTHLITSTAPVHFRPPESPAAIKTNLGWVLKGSI